jgi:cellulose synthase/poly-beta-1,6-N-acetylglucosamine synthase-like glycosyltransferase
VQRELNQGSAYLDWIRANEPGVERFSDLAKQVSNWQHKPLVSVLMPTYNSPLNYLQEAVESVQMQVYPHWELCIADDASTLPEVRVYLQQLASEDARIVLSWREKNGHISESSNTALNDCIRWRCFALWVRCRIIQMHRSFTATKTKSMPQGVGLILISRAITTGN